LLSDIPSDIASGALWISNPNIILTVPVISLVNPSAIPSKIACVLRAKNNTKEERLKVHEHEHFFVVVF